MKHLPKSTPTEILNDPYGFTYKEMSEVIGEDKARALYTELYKQPFHKENLSISTKKVYKSSDTEKYVYELKDNRYIETVFIKRRDGGTVCVKAKGDGKARTAQQTIPYLAMYPDGICKVTEKRYSKCVVFEDINYQLAQADDKTAIFENWCDFLNYFDASVSVQLLDGVADHVGLVLGRDGSRVYTVEGNSGDACKIKSYDLNFIAIGVYCWV